MKKLYYFLVALILMNGAMAQWIQQNSGTTNDLWSFSFADSISGGADRDSGTILKTSDGGNQLSIEYSDTTKNRTSVIHEITLSQGWTGLSSHLTPVNTDIESIFLPVKDQLIILYNDQGSYIPSQQVNTLINWDSQSGYIAKFSEATNLAIIGEEIQNGTITLNAGWNLMPVLSGSPVNVEAFFENKDVILVKDATSWKMFWPDMGINTLVDILPGKSYYVFTNSPATISYPSYPPYQWQCGELFLDQRDSSIYSNVQIGTQCWMTENLNIGTMIAGSGVQTNNNVIEKYCYNNTEGNCDVYGGLYQWNELMQYNTTPGVQGICPEGWHLPTDEEFCTLTTYMDPTVNCSSSGWFLTNVGGKLKESGTLHWSSPNIGATNLSGFTALPGGYRDVSTIFDGLNFSGLYWSSSIDYYSLAWYRALSNVNDDILRYYGNMSSGYSVRCLHNQLLNPPLSVSPENQNVLSPSGTTTFLVTSDTSWSVQEYVSWLTVSPMSGNGNETLSVIYGENSSTEPRIGHITLTGNSGMPVYDLTVTQYEVGWFPCGQPLVDIRDGSIYGTVQIGSQCWMKQNLNIGEQISTPNMQSDNDTIEKYCYNNEESNCNVYGGLYQWNEMMQYSTVQGVQGICPDGWHIPKKSEWNTLMNHMQNVPDFVCGNNTQYIAKALAATSNWLSSSGACHVGNHMSDNNASGFSGLPEGYYIFEGPFVLKGESNGWLSSTEYTSTGCWGRSMSHDGAFVGSLTTGKNYGHGVRCLKD